MKIIQQTDKEHLHSTYVDSYVTKSCDHLVDTDEDGYADERYYYNDYNPRYTSGDYFIDKKLNGNLKKIPYWQSEIYRHYN